jgi:hypothetical protein
MSESSSQNPQLDRYFELMTTAWKNKNYDETYRYATKVTELATSPEDLADGWAFKGLSACSIFKFEKPRIREMIENIGKAIKLDPSISKEWLAVDVSYSIGEYTSNLLDGFLEMQDSYITANRSQQVIVPQKNMSESLGAGIGAGVASVMIDNSNRKRAAKENGALFTSKYQPLILEGIKYAWSLDQSDLAVAQNIRAIIAGVITTSVIDARSKELFVSNAQQTFDEIRQKYPELTLPPIEKDKRCFIATAVLGDCNHPYLITLREYRDQKLIPISLGRHVVKVYYHYSPPLASIIERHYLLRFILFWVLIKPVVRFAKFALNDRRSIKRRLTRLAGDAGAMSQTASVLVISKGPGSSRQRA